MAEKYVKVIKPITFSDMHGTVLETYNVGDLIPYTCKVQNYYVTSMGGLYADEVVEVPT